MSIMSDRWINRMAVEHAMIERVPEEDIVEFTMGSEGFAEHFDVDAEPFFGRGMVERTVEWRTNRRSVGP